MAADLKSIVGRADLARVLAMTKPWEADGISTMLGYRSTAVTSGKKERDESGGGKPQRKAAAAHTVAELPKKAAKQAKSLGFWRVLSIEQNEETNGEVPKWVRDATPISRARLREKKKVQGKEYPCLVPWPRLWPYLKRVLSYSVPCGEVDAEELVKAISELKPIRRLPRKNVSRWASTVHVLSDRSESNAMFWDDMDELVKRLERLCGKHRLSEFIFPDGLDDECHSVRQDHRPIQYYACEKKMAVLALSTFGGTQSSTTYLDTVCRISTDVGRYGGVATALIPAPVDNWPARIRCAWQCSMWDMGKKPRIVSAATNGECSQDIQVAKKRKRDEQLHRFLALSSPIVRYEPALIRYVRALLPVNETDAAMEMAILSGAAAPRQFLSAFHLHSTPLKAAFIHLLYWFHRDVPEIRAEEMEIIRRVDADMADLVSKLTNTDEINADIVASLHGKKWQEAGFSDDEFLGYLRRKEKRLPQSAFSDERIGAAWMLSHIDDEGNLDTTEAPPALPMSKLGWTMNAGSAQKYYMHQSAQGLVAPRKKEMLNGHMLCELVTRSNLAIVKDIDHGSAYSWNIEAQGPEILTPPFASRRIAIETIDATISLDQITKPWWADEMGRDRDGLYIQLGDERYYWLAPGTFQHLDVVSTDNISEEMAKTILNQSNWIQQPAYLKAVRTKELNPFWYMNAVREDQFGAYRDFEIHGVPQRFRWIPPGEFMMGSPADEPERDDDETQHKVILTKGFWLADTACTQELWQAVMGKNPSHFKGENRPVERVSWLDCEKFINRVNKENPELKLGFPTEAQWEYACRAGTETPFSFGDNISVEQVNHYDGSSNWPVGTFIMRTVNVKSLPANPWGLYEMHGNVFEWCWDWYGNYPSGPETDPVGPVEGSNCVLRGGSWDESARGCRSAYRIHIHPDDRNINIGFRLSRGPIALSQGAEPHSEETEVAGSATGEATSEKTGFLGVICLGRRNEISVCTIDANVSSCP